MLAAGFGAKRLDAAHQQPPQSLVPPLTGGAPIRIGTSLRLRTSFCSLSASLISPRRCGKR